MRRVVVAVVLCTACVQRAPQARVQVAPGEAHAGRAVIVMPTTCVVDGDWPWMCAPGSWKTDNQVGPGIASYSEVIDPLLRLKLEFAGYTLLEGAAMRLTTAADHVAAAPVATGSTGGPAQTVAELAPSAVRDVARSLGLSGVITSTVTLRPTGLGESSLTLEVVLWDVATSASRWRVDCTVPFYDLTASNAQVANCVGNGLLAAMAPGDLIGSAL